MSEGNNFYLWKICKIVINQFDGNNFFWRQLNHCLGFNLRFTFQSVLCFRNPEIYFSSLVHLDFFFKPEEMREFYRKK